MLYIDSESHPILSWCHKLEESALSQAKNLANVPFLFRHVALMPDTHAGYGMPIGGVIATENVIIPNAVGVDIGCGMRAVKTNIPVGDLNRNEIKEIMKQVRDTVPVGFEHHQDDQLFFNTIDKTRTDVIEKHLNSAKKQIGTLGGGNHFIEIQKGSDGYLWYMIHSGSRNVGLKVAKYYNDQAKEFRFTNIDPEWDLAPLPIDEQVARDYITDMSWCLEFARSNRELMSGRVLQAFEAVIGFYVYTSALDIHHNYVALENHFGRNVYIHRKGATSAYKDERGVIPGSQGTASYIVRGLGNEDSFKSCSHGAGRRMGRKQARQILDLQTEIARLDEKEIIHAIRNKDDLDEASGAYKDIDVVMEEQKDLVEIEVRLEPLAVIKG